MRILLFLLTLLPLLANTELQIAIPEANIPTTPKGGVVDEINPDMPNQEIPENIQTTQSRTHVLPPRPTPQHPESRTMNWIEPPFAKAGTEVNIYVGEKLSMVEETATYDYVQFLDREMKEHVFFHFPIFIPKEIDLVETTTKDFDVILKIEGQEFAPVWQAEIEITDKFQAPPENFKLVMMSFSIPRKFLRERSRITLSYVQEHYLYNERLVVAYYPYLPYYERLKQQMKLVISDYTVSFRLLSKDKVVLHRLTGNTPVQSDTPSLIQVRPVHQENIAVEVRPITAPAQ